MTDPFRDRVRNLWAAYYAADQAEQEARRQLKQARASTAEAKAELDRFLEGAAEPPGVAPLYDLAEQPRKETDREEADRVRPLPGGEAAEGGRL